MDQPETKGGFLPILLSVGGFFLVLVLVALVWADRRPEPPGVGGFSPEERAGMLREQRERDREMLDQYGWIDRDAGIVRLPIDRAMELYLEEINQGGEAQN